MTDPVVSVIIPVFNRADLVGRAIASVLAQDMTSLEIIVVDDASTDAIDRALEAIDDSRLRIQRHAINRGAGAARNTGVRAAHGTYVAFLDSDDEWLPNKLSRQLALLKDADAHVAGAVSGFVIDRGIGSEIQIVVPSLHKELLFRLLWGCDLSPGATLLCRRSCFEEVGYFDEDMRRLEDWDWLLRFAQRFELALAREALAVIHVASVPRAAQVTGALATIAQRYQPIADRMGVRAGRIFQSTILLERAALAFRERHQFAAIRLVLASLRTYPGRDWRFFLRMGQHLLGGLGRVLRRRAEAGQSSARASVLHVITTLQTGGAENMLAQLVRRDHELGRRQWVAMLRDGGIHAERLSEAGIGVTPLHVNCGREAFGGLIRLIRLIRRERPDVVVGWMYHANLLLTLALYLSGRLYRTRLIWGLRNSEMDFRQYQPALRSIVRLSALLSRLPEIVVANSQAGFEYHRRLGFRPSRYYIIDNGVDTRRFAPDEALRVTVRAELGLPAEACVAIMVARVDPMKDYTTLLAALRRSQGLTVLAVGRDTETLADTPGLIKLGERRDVARLLAASDVLVLSSAFGEGVPNAVLEGMATSLAIIATDVGDTRRVVGDGGIIVPPRDPVALAAALVRLKDDIALRRDYGAAARVRAETKFSIARASAAFDMLIDSPSAPVWRWSIIPLAPPSR